MVLCEKTTETIFFGLIIGPRVRYDNSFVTGKAKGGKKYKAKVTCCFSNASNGFDRLEEK